MVVLPQYAGERKPFGEFCASRDGGINNQLIQDLPPRGISGGNVTVGGYRTMQLYILYVIPEGIHAWTSRGGDRIEQAPAVEQRDPGLMNIQRGHHIRRKCGAIDEQYPLPPPSQK
jgi:hypothetical protein